MTIETTKTEKQKKNTVNSPVSEKPRELKEVSVSRAVRLRELFP